MVQAPSEDLSNLPANSKLTLEMDVSVNDAPPAFTIEGADAFVVTSKGLVNTNVLHVIN